MQDILWNMHTALLSFALFVLFHQLLADLFDQFTHILRGSFTAIGGSHNIVPMSVKLSWWRHQMETFSALLVLCGGNSPVTGEFPAQRPVTRSFDVYFDLRLNKRLSKQPWCWWFETLSWRSWRHCNDPEVCEVIYQYQTTTKHNKTAAVCIFLLMCCKVSYTNTIQT